MKSSIFSVLLHLPRSVRRWRNRRQLPPVAKPQARSVSATGASGASGALTLGCGVLFAGAGALLLATHALRLGGAGAAGVRSAPAFQAALPGAHFAVQRKAGVALLEQPGGALLVLAGMQRGAPVQVDLCSQRASETATRLMPLRIGYGFADVKTWVGQNQKQGRNDAPGLKNVLLDSGTGADDVPELVITGPASGDFTGLSSQPLQLNWGSRQHAVRLLSDVSDVSGAQIQVLPRGQRADAAMRREAWLVWDASPAGGSDAATGNPAASAPLARRALHVQRVTSPTCPQAGQLLLQLFKPVLGNTAPARKSLVQAFPALGGAVQSAWLAAGAYRVPHTAAQPLEDQTMFADLQRLGLLRLAANGRIEIAPRDLPAWAASGQSGRAAGLDNWRAVRHDAETLKLIKRLYQFADGAYVRQQVEVFNGERHLSALRLKSNFPGLQDGFGGDAGWRAFALDAQGMIPVGLTAAMPVVAARLLADLPQAWGPWVRLEDWRQGVPARDAAGQGDAGGTLQIQIPLLQLAQGGEHVEMMLIGRLIGVQGARMLGPVAGVCSGRACPNRDVVGQVTLVLAQGASALTLQVQALALSDLRSNREVAFQHIRVQGGQLRWQALVPKAVANATVTAHAEVALKDRNGALLWANGSATPAASAAGLAAMLGLRAEHSNSVAGVLSRLAAMPDAGGLGQAQVAARLSLDLNLQTLSQRVLDCVGMRGGQWDGKQCSGAQPIPALRRAGMVIIDTEIGDILAAASGGGGQDVGGAGRWEELRDFDRGNPARSPLRVAAWQHDGGAFQSPGSSFKPVTALGLETAAAQNKQLDALLGGAALAQINHVAQQRGFAFRTDGACYPLPCDAHQAHVTNYREQHLDRRALDGRFGLAQAITYSINTWFAWTNELSDQSLFGRANGGAPDVQALDGVALDHLRPVLAAAHRLGFERAMHLDGGLLPENFPWATWDALQSTPSHIDASHTRHELRQMAIGLRMQTTPLQMALVAAAIGQGGVVQPRLLLGLQANGVERKSKSAAPDALPMRLDRIRAGMKGVVDRGTAASAFAAPALRQVRLGLYGKTGTAPVKVGGADGGQDVVNTVWFTGWLEPGSVPGQKHRWAFAAFASHSQLTGGAHAAPMVAGVLGSLPIVAAAP
jgi:cell division protein FtsI/penicillin-binding protein 2